MEHTGTAGAEEPIWSTLARAADLLEKDPRRTEELAHVALRFAPGLQQALQLLIAARRSQGDESGSQTLLQSMAAETPSLASVLVELGLLLADVGDIGSAVRALSRCVELEPSHPQAWRTLGDCLLDSGERTGAAHAYRRHFASLAEDLKMLEQLGAFALEQSEIAQGVLREYLAASPTDLLALSLLGNLELRAHQFEPAERTFARALAVDSTFQRAQAGLASARNRQTTGLTAAEVLSPILGKLAEMLASNPETTAARAGEILGAYPGQMQTLFLLTSAFKLMGAEERARETLAQMAGAHPNLASLAYELGMMAARLGLREEAVVHLSRAVELEPQHASAWRALSCRLAAAGNMTAASRACMRHLKLSLRELKLLEDASAACRIEELPRVQGMLRQGLEINPTDVFANRLLGEIYLRFGKLKDAQACFARALELAPGCTIARERYGQTLTQLMEWKAANEQFEILLRADPGNPHLEGMIAANLVMQGETEEGTRLFERAASRAVRDTLFWQKYAQAAKTAGMSDETIVAAYRKSLDVDRGYGAAWWGLADMKTYRFSAADIDVMREQLRRDDLPAGQRCHIEFALGKALEDDRAFAESFEHYARANALRRPFVSYSADTADEDARRAIAFFTSGFFAARKDAGCPSPDPIFIVGMPRAGSTLIEQILASHPLVEGTMELPDLGHIVGELIEKHGGDAPYPVLLSGFGAAALREIGQDYLERTRRQRKLDRPFFTDKAGKNFFHAALIHLVLPNARIVDARRHPLACGFSCFKQAFAPGAVPFAYDQTDIGRYYRGYARIMAHIDRVLPGRVHRVIHEDLVYNPEKEIRRLLAYCGLPFEEGCLRFHETERSIRTASSLQVRQPIRKKSSEAWQDYEMWLQPMKDALGDVLTRYPEAPAFGGW